MKLRSHSPARVCFCCCVLALGAGVAGCESPRAAPPNTVRIPLTAEPTTLDPARVEDGPTIEVLMHLYDGLVEWRAGNRIGPALAQRWTVSPDGRTYTFLLRRGVHFQSGREVTAQDFVFSLNRALLPATQSTVASTYLNDLVGARDVLAGRARQARGIRALSRYVLQLTIDQPKAYFLSKLTYPTAYVLDRAAVQADPTGWTEHPAGTGPFRLLSWQHNRKLVLGANPDYFEGRPRIDRIERPIVLDVNTRHFKFEDGETDETDVPMGDYIRDLKDPVLGPQLHAYSRASIFYLSMNETAFPPFRDRRVRRAINQAIDKDALIRVVMNGLNTRADGILPPGVPGYDPAYRGLPYDPAEARRQLAAAGYPGGRGFPPFTLTFREKQADLLRFAEGIAYLLRRNLGLRVGLREMEWGTFLQERDRGTLQISLLRWMADYLDPQDFLSMLLHTGSEENKIGYSNRQFDRLCDVADVERNPVRRIALYRQAERIAVEDGAWVPLYFQRDVELWNPRVHGIVDTQMGHLPLKQAWVSNGRTVVGRTAAGAAGSSGWAG